MAYAIMRCKKIKTNGGVASSLQHCFRERITHNADPERLSDNKHAFGIDSVDKAMGKMRERLPEKRRKDAVLMVEYMMTASPDWFEQATEEMKKDFFNSSHAWLCEKYGAENVIVSTIHNDETTPHLSAFVTPVTAEGRLSAKEFIGNKSKMSEDQTTFAEKVRHLGLKRGIRGSKANHQTIKQYYELANKTLSFEVITEKDLEARKFRGKGILKHVPINFQEESKEGIANRISDKVRGAYAIATNLRNIEQREKSLREVAEKARIGEIQAKKALVSHKLDEQGLTKEQLRQLEDIKKMMKYENAQKEKLRKSESLTERMKKSKGVRR